MISTPPMKNSSFRICIAGFLILCLFLLSTATQAQRVSVISRSTAAGEGCWAYTSDSVSSPTGSAGYPNTSPRWIPLGGIPANLCTACPSSQRHTSTYDGERYEIISRTSRINFRAVNVAPYKDLQLSLTYGNSEGTRAGQRNNGPGWDITDQVTLLPSAGTVVNDFIPGAGNTDVYNETLTHNVPNTATTFSFAVEIRVNRVDELVLLRNIDLTGPRTDGGLALGKDITASATSTCPGGSITLSADASIASQGWTYQWQRNGTNLNGETNATLTLTNLDASRIGAYRVVYLPTAISPGCALPPAASAAVSISLTIGQLPQVTTASTALCPGTATVLRSSLAGTQYRWFRNDTLITAGTVDSLLTNRPGSYKVEVTTATCVVTSVPLQITGVQRPLLTLASALASICPNQGTRLTASGAQTYVWKPATGLSSTTGDTVYASPDTSTTYTLIGIGGNGCVDSTTIRVVVNPVPVLATAATDTSVCSSTPITLTVSGATAYTWFSTAGTQVGTGSTLQLAPTQNERYRIIGTNASGCTDTLFINVNALPLPQADAGQNQRICLGSTVTLGSVPLVGLRYVWQNRALLNDSTLAQPIFRANRPGIYRLPLRVQNIGTGCQSLDTATVVVDSLPTMVANARNTTICQGEALTLASLNSRPYSYAWQPAQNLNAAGVSNPVFTYSARLQRDSVFKWFFSATNAQGCTITDTITITVLARPDARAALGASVCVNATAPIGLTGAVPAGLTYAWKGAAVRALSSASVAAPVFDPSMVFSSSLLLRDTTVNLTLIVSRDGSACKDSVVVSVLVRPQPAALGGPDVTLCAGATASLGAVAPGYLRNWTLQNGVGSLNNSQAEQPVFQAPTGFGTDSISRITVLATDIRTGCQRLDTVLVAILTAPALQPLPTATQPLRVCAGTTRVLRARPLAVGNDYIYEWYLAGQLVSSDSTLVVNNGSGNAREVQSYTLLVKRGAAACPSTYTAVVELLPAINLSLTHNNPWLCPLKENFKTYTARPAQQGTQYVWTVVGGSILTADSNAVTVRWPAGALVYELKVSAITSAGCTTADVILPLKVDEKLSEAESGCSLEDYPLLVPNVITPNADGVNDTFGIDNLQFYPALKLQVFNRYGVEVYNQTAYTNTWSADGLPAGTYYYVLDTRRGRSFKGFVEVVR